MSRRPGLISRFYRQVENRLKKDNRNVLYRSSDDLALNRQIMPVIQTKITFSIIGNKYTHVYYVFYPIKLGKHKSLQIVFTYFWVSELFGLM